jgi:putative exosortase-associated protein (TIGR04073 family)
LTGAKKGGEDMQKVLTVLILVAAIVMVSSSAVLAASGTLSGTKMERGVKNVALGWTEIPKQIVDTSKQSNVIAGVTVGLVKGVLQAFARTASGAVDVATFPVGAYDRPAIKPSMLEEEAGTK